jgi:hypothetical protein
MCDDDENLIQVFDDASILNLDWQLSQNEIGALHVVLPQLYDPRDFAPFRTLLLERNVGRGFEIVENRRWFLLDWDFFEDENGAPYTELLAEDSNTLLDGYVAAYAQGSSQADRTDEFDDLCKLVVSENIVSPTDTTRAISGISVETGTGDAGSETVSISYKNLLACCKEFANGSWEAGTYLIFDMESTGPGTFEMRTWTTQMGEDRTSDSGQPCPVRLRSPRLKNKFSGMRNAIYALGQGSKAARVVKTASNAAWIGYSKFARRELAPSASGIEDQAAVTAFAKAQLYKNRPRKILTGEIVDEPGLRYGIDFGWGDLITAAYFGQDFDCHIASVGASYGPEGETLSISVRGESE